MSQNGTLVYGAPYRIPHTVGTTWSFVPASHGRNKLQATSSSGRITVELTRTVVQWVRRGDLELA